MPQYRIKPRLASLWDTRVRLLLEVCVLPARVTHERVLSDRVLILCSGCRLGSTIASPAGDSSSDQCVHDSGLGLRRDRQAQMWTHASHTLAAHR